MKTPNPLNDSTVDFIPFELLDDSFKPTSRNLILFTNKIPDQHYWTSRKCRQIAKYLLKIADWKDELK